MLTFDEYLSVAEMSFIEVTIKTGVAPPGVENRGEEIRISLGLGRAICSFVSSAIVEMKAGWSNIYQLIVILYVC